jgi:hypothetical protein
MADDMVAGERKAAGAHHAVNTSEQDKTYWPTFQLGAPPPFKA